MAEIASEILNNAIGIHTQGRQVCSYGQGVFNKKRFGMNNQSPVIGFVYLCFCVVAMRQLRIVQPAVQLFAGFGAVSSGWYCLKN
jgi:hypothetical protein